MFYLPAIAFSRLSRSFIRRFRPGGGSALPGLLLSKIAPKLLARTLRSFKQGVVVITGSAGKSTTTKMVVAIVEAHGLRVFTNPSTANIRQGFFSSIIEQSDLFARVPGDIAILEVDEAHAESITAEVAPRIVTLLNVLEDQLDRFVDPALVRKASKCCRPSDSKCSLKRRRSKHNLRRCRSEPDRECLVWYRPKFVR